MERVELELELDNLELEVPEGVEDETSEEDTDTSVNEEEPEELEVDDEDTPELEDEDENISEDSVEEENSKEERGESSEGDLEVDESSEDDGEVFYEFASSIKGSFFPEVNDEDLKSISSLEDIENLMLETFNKEVGKVKETYKSDLVNHLINEGVIKKEQVEDIELAGPQSKEEILDNVDKQEQVIKEYYKSKGLSEKEVNKLIEGSLDLEEDALEVFDKLEEVRKEKSKALAEKMEAQKREQRKAQLQAEENMKKAVYEYDEFIPGKKIPESIKNRVFKKIPETLKKINSDMEKYFPILAYMDEYGILDKKFDTLIKTGKSQGVSDFSKVLKQKRKSSGKSTVNNKKDSLSLPKRKTIYD